MNLKEKLTYNFKVIKKDFLFAKHKVKVLISNFIAMIIYFLFRPKKVALKTLKVAFQNGVKKKENNCI